MRTFSIGTTSLTLSMLTLNNFEQEIDSKMLQKGRQYFESGAVISLDEGDNGRWQAEVEGTDTYETEVQLKKGKELVDYFCNCPYDGDLCKHVIAVLYAIRQETASSGRTNERKEKKKSFDELLQNISIEEYREFIRQYAAGNKEFRAEFELWFAAKNKGIDVDKQYETLLRKIISKHSDHGFVDYSASFRLSKEVDRLLDIGFAQVKKKQYKEAFGLAKAALGEMMEVVMACDDSAGSIGTTVHNVIELLKAIAAEPSIPPAVLKELYGFIKVELNDQQYFNYGDFGYELFDLFRRLSIEQNKEYEFLSFIDTQLPTLQGKKERPPRHGVGVGKRTTAYREAGKRQRSHPLIHQKICPRPVVAQHGLLPAMEKNIYTGRMERGI